METQGRVVSLTHVELIQAAVPPRTTTASKKGDTFVPVNETKISPTIPVVIATMELRDVIHP